MAKLKLGRYAEGRLGLEPEVRRHPIKPAPRAPA